MNEVWLGDFARCLDRLELLDVGQVETVARLLGFALEEETVEPHADDSPGPESTHARPIGEPRATGESFSPAVDPIPRPRLSPIERRPPVPVEIPATTPLPRYEDTVHGTPPPHEPLWDPRWTRELVAAAAATPTLAYEVDVPRAIEIVSRGWPLTEIPRRRTRTLAFGAQVLVDLSSAMDPFARDRDSLLEEIRNVVGKDRVSLLRFSTFPTHSGPRGRSSWEAYRPPDAGSPVLALTDLGIGGPLAGSPPDVAREWITLADTLRRRRSRLIAIVPYPPRRWPTALREALRILQWDRPTTVGRVLRSVLE